MKSCIITVLALAVAALARPEPPVNNYLPPSYSTTHQDSFAPPPSAPSSTYGAPSAPASTYGAPSAPSNTYGAPSALSNTYGAPSAPSSTYGAPSSTYGAPGFGSGSRSSSSSSFSSSRSGSKSRFGGGAPSQTYGAPAQTAAIFAPSSAPSSAYGAPGAFGGYPASKGGGQDDLSEPAMYEFSYQVQDAPSGNDFGHRESRQGDVAWGSYQVLLPDGRKQIVDYQADQNGYNPKIRYEETGYAASRGAGGPY